MTYQNPVNKTSLDADLAKAINGQPVIIFDGVCNFCNAAINFIIRHDPKAVFRFAAIQSHAGQALINRFGLAHLNNETLIVIKSEQYFIYSHAAFEIAKQLTWPYRALSWLRFLPKALCDFAYKLFARHRYSLFGKKDHCMLPTAAIKSRFLE